VKRVSGGLLVQEKDYARPKDLKVVTKRAPTPEEMASLEFCVAGGEAREIERHRPGARRSNGGSGPPARCRASIP